MTISELVNAIAAKHQKQGFALNPPATEDEINNFETIVGFPLPADFRQLYSICNGFECLEDIFRFIPLDEIVDYSPFPKKGENWFDFSEYMIYSDTWLIRKSDQYEIVNGDPDKGTVLTTSLIEFLEHFLWGNVFEENGLYKWQELIDQNNSPR